MSEEPALITRQELAALLGIKLGTFWSWVLDYNKKAAILGWAVLAPDKLEDHGNFKKFLFNPARVDEFRAALAKRKEKS